MHVSAHSPKSVLTSNSTLPSSPSPSLSCSSVFFQFGLHVSLHFDSSLLSSRPPAETHRSSSKGVLPQPLAQLDLFSSMPSSHSSTIYPSPKSEFHLLQEATSPPGMCLWPPHGPRPPLILPPHVTGVYLPDNEFRISRDCAILLTASQALDPLPLPVKTIKEC